jgi:hypothetical protein
MRSQLMPVFIVLFILLLIARISIAAGQKRRARFRILHRFVAVRYQASPDFAGDRSEFEEALKEVRRAFRNDSGVIAALDYYRDHMVERSGADTASRDITEAIHAMCRSLKMDPTTVSLNLTD